MVFWGSIIFFLSSLAIDLHNRWVNQFTILVLGEDYANGHVGSIDVDMDLVGLIKYYEDGSLNEGCLEGMEGFFTSLGHSYLIHASHNKCFNDSIFATKPLT
jgi:hypothetical protein